MRARNKPHLKSIGFNSSFALSQDLGQWLNGQCLVRSLADINFAYPTAELAVMGPDGAVNIVYRREIAAAEDAVAAKDGFVAQYREKFANPYKAAGLGFIDEVIYPRQTRPRLCDALTLLRDKRLSNPPKKHDNLPL